MPPLPPSFLSWLDYYRFIVAHFPPDVDPLDRDRAHYEIIYKYFDGQKEVKHTLLLWQLKWLCFDEIQPMLLTHADALLEYQEMGHFLMNTSIELKRQFKLVDLLKFFFQNQNRR